MTTEGDPEHFFPPDTLKAVSNEQERAAEVEVQALEGLDEYDIQRLCAEGCNVHDDNETASKKTTTSERLYNAMLLQD